MEITPEIVTEVCRRIADGESLRQICADGKVSKWCFLEHLGKNTEAANQYARAREEQADHYAEEIVAIADQAPGQTEHGTDSGAVQHQKLRVDARKWVASKLRPKVYGDKIQQEHTGPNGTPIQIITGVPT